ncbi:MAG: citrate/2-methylcitrate synthase [Acidimicrobiales bacterium]
MSSERSRPGGGLTTSEVAEILGVKRQTVYAYVSRGILHRQMAIDGRTSIFDRTEVEELRLGRRPEQEGEMRTMLTTRLTRVSDDGLWIRGVDLIDLVNQGAGFTEVADLLWSSSGDESWPLTPSRQSVTEGGSTDGSGDGGGERGWVPAADGRSGALTLLDQLRIIVAIESSADALRHDLSPKSVRAAGRRAIVAMANGLGTAATPPPGSSTSLGGVLWSRLSRKQPKASQRRAVDVALALLADHGLAASTFAARVAASVKADPYSVISAGLGVFGGTLHGAASAEVHELHLEAERRGDAATVVGDRQRRGRVPGFGHMVYRSQDPRYGALMAQIIDAWADDQRLQTVFRVRDVVGERSDAIPNVDLALGALTYLAGMPTDAGEALFAVSRTAGWLAHAIEEYEEKPLRFRPRARYIGDRPPGH